MPTTLGSVVAAYALDATERTKIIAVDRHDDSVSHFYQRVRK